MAAPRLLPLPLLPLLLSLLAASAVEASRCPRGPAPSIPPGKWMTSVDVARVQGWNPGRFKTFFDQSFGWTKVTAFHGISALACAQMAYCYGKGKGPPAKYISWKGVTNSGTRGTCELLREETCSAKYSATVDPFVDDPQWVSARLIGDFSGAVNCDNISL